MQIISVEYYFIIQVSLLNSFFKNIIHFSRSSRNTIFKLFLYVLILYSTACLLYADAYLSEDRVYYGADSYTIDYDREIIYAKGNAFFNKENRIVNAEKIEIYYSKTEKRALFYNNVIIQNRAQKSRIHGNYAEAIYNEEIYTIQGDAVYIDEDRTIKAQRIETLRGVDTVFYDDVEYTDGIYEIGSSTLHITDDTARFKTDVEAQNMETGDIIYCDSFTYFLDSGNIIFQGNVLYFQKEKKGEKDPLIMKAELLRYFHENDIFLFLGDVLILSGDLTIRTSIARYLRDKGTLEATGDIVVQDRENFIYCNNVNYDIQTKKVVYFNFVRGVISGQ